MLLPDPDSGCRPCIKKSGLMNGHMMLIKGTKCRELAPFSCFRIITILHRAINMFFQMHLLKMAGKIPQGIDLWVLSYTLYKTSLNPPGFDIFWQEGGKFFSLPFQINPIRVHVCLF